MIIRLSPDIRMTRMIILMFRPIILMFRMIDWDDDKKKKTLISPLLRSQRFCHPITIPLHLAQSCIFAVRSRTVAGMSSYCHPAGEPLVPDEILIILASSWPSGCQREGHRKK